MEYMHTNRVIVLVDMDCFYCQVEEKLNPKLVGKPIAVVQYNAWKGGGIIAVNYPARDKGVTRHMRGNEAREKCPDIILVSVPTLREKADLTKYRDAGKEVAAVLQVNTELLERASVDEAYMDITDAVNKRIAAKHPITVTQFKNTHVVGCEMKDFLENFKYEHFLESNLKLCMGGIITEEIRAEIFEKTGYKCSAGIAHNKTLAKLACGLHKPNQQTILPQDGVDGLFATLPLRKIRSLGGKFGCNLGEDLGIKTMGELKKFSEKDLISRYDEKSGAWLYKIARGIDVEPVTVRLVSKSIGCCKKFPGKTALTEPEDVLHWINQLSIEICERLQKDFEENNRKAKHMVVGFVQKIGKKDESASRTHALNSYEPLKVADDMLKVINKHCLNTNGTYHIKYLGVSAGKFEDYKKRYDISSYFKTCDKQIDTNITKPENNVSYFLSNMNENETNKIKSNTTKLSNVNDSINNCKNLDEICTSNLDGKIHLNEQCGNSNDQLESDDTSSVFSQDTVLMDYNEDDFIFNENYKKIDDVSGNSVVRSKDSNDSETDSITDEIIGSYEERADVPQEGTSSYFANFFNNMESFNRNFDTSRYLEDETDNCESESSSTNNGGRNSNTTTEDHLVLTEICENSDPKDIQAENTANKTHFGSSETDRKGDDVYSFSNPTMRTSFDEAFNSTTKGKCKECSKLIEKTEMLSHMDYHFALQIVRNESHLYSAQNNATSSNQTKKSAESKQIKRKWTEVAAAKLTTFFENKSQNTLTKRCTECNKDVSSDEFLSHLDFHVAKKLHSELNPIIGSTSLKAQNLKKSSTAVSKEHRTLSVISYFKQNM